jgi:hypothetical protein
MLAMQQGRLSASDNRLSAAGPGTTDRIRAPGGRLEAERDETEIERRHNPRSSVPNVEK